MFIKRNDFVTLFYEILGESFLGIIHGGKENDAYKVWCFNQEVYLLQKDTGVIINWYKLNHVGRDLSFNTEISSLQLYEFLNDLKEELG